MIRLPMRPAPTGHLGADTTTCAPCQATSCFNTGLATLLLGGIVGAFVGANVGSFVAAYHLTKPK